MLTTNVDAMVPEGPSARANPARGIVLIATALILGLFVLRQGFETIDGQPAADGAPASQEQSDDASDSQTGSDGEDGGNATPPESQPEEQPALSASELTVRVSNTTSAAGAAANWSCLLGNNEYNMVEAKQAGEERDQRELTVVMFVQGLDREATQLSQAVGEGVGVEPMPAEPPQDVDGQPLTAEGVQLVVLLGTDQAGVAEPCPE